MKSTKTKIPRIEIPREMRDCIFGLSLVELFIHKPQCFSFHISLFLVSLSSN